MKRILSWLLALVLTVGLLPVNALPVSATEAFEIGTPVQIAEDPGLPGNEELFAGYAYQQFYGETATYRRLAGDLLVGDEKVIYDALVPLIKQIASGQRDCTIVGIGQQVTVSGTVYKADVPATFTGAGISNDALTRIMWALLSDYPYEMYWYDKVSGCMALPITSSGKNVNLQFYFVVAHNYGYDGDCYAVNTTYTRQAAAAAQKSRDIVSKYADKADYEKLLGYKDEICGLVSYDYDAASSNQFSYDNDPWQLIHVFDGISTTNVVCEGYSKAFMYLCEQTEFQEDISCYLTVGVMGGAHMWNIVTIDGRNYLVDVTNSESNCVGSDGSLFLAGGTGSISGGYMVGGYLYTYDAMEVSAWGTGSDSILALANQNYTPPAAHTHDYDGEMICTVCGHKAVDLQITAAVLRPDCAGLYYTGSFQIEEGVAVSRMGIALSLSNQMPVADNSDQGCMWTEGITSILVRNILKENEPSNADRAEMLIYARAYAQLTDGTYIYSDVVTVNLRQVVEAADTQWATLDKDQKEAITDMYARFETIMEAWDLTTIKS